MFLILSKTHTNIQISAEREIKNKLITEVKYRYFSTPFKDEHTEVILISFSFTLTNPIKIMTSYEDELRPKTPLPDILTLWFNFGYL